MSKITVQLKGKVVDDLKELREETGIPIAQMIKMVLKGYTIVEIATGRDLLEKLREEATALRYE